MSAESGWYPDTTRAGTERFWDGGTWTQESRWPGTHPFASPVPADLPVPEASLEVEAPVFRPVIDGMPHESTVGFWLPPTDWLAHARSAPPPERPRRRAPKSVSLGLVAVLVAGGSFLIFGRNSSADAAVAAAVNSSLANHTADLVINASGGTATGKFVLSGYGGIDFSQNAMEITMNVDSGSQQMAEQAVFLNDVCYLSLGDELSSVLPGKSWTSLDLGQVAQGSTSPSSLSVLSVGSLGSLPAAVLDALSQDGNTATDRGPSTINNVHVEAYEVRFDQAAIQQQIVQDHLSTWLGQEIQQVSNANVDYKVYIDGSGRLAAMTVDTTETVNGVAVDEVVTMDFSDYGVPFYVTAPPADQVATFQSLLQAFASSANSAN